MSTNNESPAFSAFHQNMGRMLHLFELLKEGAYRTSAELDSFSSLLNIDDPENLDQLEQLNKSLKARVEKHKTQADLLTEWSCVMLVTFTETYLQDALSYFAGLDPSMMGDSEQKASYKEVISASSLTDLLEDLRGRWARNVIDDGGPRKWVDRLKRMGASSLEGFDVQLMEELWGSRHLIVHRAGKVTRDFLNRHPGHATAVGDQLVIPWDKVPQYIAYIADFIKTVEKFLVNRQAGRSRQST